MKFVQMHGSESGRRQSGSVLLVAVVLLLLASIVTLFALQVGTFEQRSSGNDVRAKLVQQVADSALTQGAEMLLANSSLLTTGLGTTWVQCAADETAFPCGAVPAAKRATMYRYSAGTFDVFGDGTVDAMDERMLPLDRRFTTVNDTATGGDGFPVRYGVGVVMCRLAPAAITAAGPSCSTSTGDQIGTYAFTLVAVADMGADGGRATAVKSFATNSTFSLLPNQPPIMASGTIDIKGTFQAVTSANGGGPGVPVSVWTRKEMDPGGTPDTCYPDEFFRSGTPTWHPDASDPNKILRCDNCSCNTAKLTSVQGNTCTGGRDILTNPAPSCSDANHAVRPEEFPCDLFEHIFGVKARRDTDGDHFCETLITAADPRNPSTQVGVDELYLAEKANWIVSATTGFGARFSGDARLVSCDVALTKSGLIWLRSDCDLKGTIGSPGAPVLVVKDGAAKINANTVIFGLVFVRSTGTAALNPATGGNGTIQANGAAAIYGGIVVQGVADKLNGTGAVIYDATVMGNLVNQLSNPDVLGLPGSWTDTVRY